MLAHNTKDTGLRFEESGCDYVFVDEAHMYKNMQRLCNIEELSYPNGSRRAEDLGLKLQLLRQRRRDEAIARGIRSDAVIERVATFATGTPIANSLGELWVLQTYLRPDLLAATGVADLGDWGAAFTATHTTIEVNATGTKLKPVTRVAKYTNLPELLALSNAYTDVVTRDQVPVQLPTLRTGARQIISMQPDTELTDFIADLGWRADNLDPRKPERDNMLKISNDGRNASLDPRLAHLGTPTHSRAAEVAEQATRIHQRHKHNHYRDPDTKNPNRCAAACKSCSAIVAPPETILTNSASTKPSRMNWSPVECRHPRCVSSTKRATPLPSKPYLLNAIEVKCRY